MSRKVPPIKRGLAPAPPVPPQPLRGHPGALVELREVGPEECDGAGEKYRLRWRRVVVADGLDDETRRALRLLRLRGVPTPPLMGDELPPEPGATRRGVPLDYDGSDPSLCNARCVTGRPCRALALQNGRCRRHGGMSSGPRTEAGKRRSALNLIRAREVLARRRQAGGA